MKKKPDPLKQQRLVDYLPTIYSNLRRSHATKHRNQFMEHYSWLVGCQLRFNMTDTEVAAILADLCDMSVEAVKKDILRFQKWRRRLGYLYGLRDETEIIQPRPPDMPMFLFLFLPLEEDQEIIVTHLEQMYIAVHNRFGRRKANCWLWWQVLASAVPLVAKSVRKWFVRVAAGGGATWLTVWLRDKGR